MYGKMTSHMIRAAAAVTASLGIAMPPVSASTIPANATYADTFPSPGTRGTDLESDAPEINTSGTIVTYDGWHHHTEVFQVATTATANAVNDGSNGVISLTPTTSAVINDYTMVLPVPGRRFTVQVDFVPFNSNSTQNSRSAGLILTDVVNESYNASDSDDIRVGIGGATNDRLHVQQAHGDSYNIDTADLNQFAADNWNHLRMDVDLDAQSVTVFFNQQKVGQYVFTGLGDAAYVGLDAFNGAISGDGAPGTVYFDNFSVSPLPEPGSLALLGLGGLLMLSRKRLDRRDKSQC